LSAVNLGKIVGKSSRARHWDLSLVASDLFFFMILFLPFAQKKKHRNRMSPILTEIRKNKS